MVAIFALSRHYSHGWLLWPPTIRHEEHASSRSRYASLTSFSQPCVLTRIQGEAAGFIISAANHYASIKINTHSGTSSSPLNHSSSYNPVDLTNDFTKHDLRRRKYFETF